MLKKSIALLLLGLMIVLPVAAQDDNQATFDRVVAAVQNTNNLQSYLKSSSSQSIQQFTLIQDGAEIQSSNTSETEESLTAIQRGENPNGFYAVIRTASEDDTSYTIQGELRFVDGVLYGAGQYIEGEYFYTFDEGFVVVDDAYLGDLTAFGTTAFVSEINGTSTDDNNPFSDPQVLFGVMSSLTTEAGDLDGVPVEIITMTIDATGLGSLMTSMGGGAEEAEMVNGLLAFTDETSGATLVAYLGEGDQLLKTEFTMTINALNVDMSQLDPQMAGFNANFSIQMNQSDIYSQIDAVTEVIAAP